jgi:hypothetical protein
MYRSTFGGLVGALAATASYWFIPPTVVQELLLNLGLAVSIDMASYVGTIAVGIAGTIATRFAPSQPEARS